MPADLTVALGGGGGVAGSWSESRVLASGHVVDRESGPGAGPPHIRGCLPPASRRAMWEAMHREGFFELESRPGNMSESLSATWAGRTAHVTWALEQGPPAFRAVRAVVRTELAKAEPSPAEPAAGGDGIELSVAVVPPARKGPRPPEPLEDAGPWSPALALTITNRSGAALRVPNGRTTAGYMFAPFGLELELRNLQGEAFEANPGAGGPALPIGAAHFARLAPGDALRVAVPVGRRIHGLLPNPRELWREPGVYVARLRWRCRPEGFVAPPGDAPVWSGATPWIETAFVLE